METEQQKKFADLFGISEEINNIVQSFLSGFSFGELHGIDKQDMEKVYVNASNLFDVGKYQEAEEIFESLCFFGQSDKRFWFGLGAAREKQKNYAGAVKAYGSASIYDLKDPKPKFHMAMCYLQDGHKDAAITALEELLRFTPKTSNNQNVLKVAEGMIARLSEGGDESGNIPAAEGEEK